MVPDTFCQECGGPCTDYDDEPVAHHVTVDGDIDYDADANHDALPEDY